MKTRLVHIDVIFVAFENYLQKQLIPVAQIPAEIAEFRRIMEGCSKYCTFCVVPYTGRRGVPAIRQRADLAELAEQGVKEVTLLGQNVNAYRGRMEEGDSADFALLIEYIADVPGIERIRYTTSHPREFTPRLIEAYARIPKLVSHVHLPVQTGSDRVLAAMKRGYTVLEYKSIVRRLRERRPEMSISSDFIVGFPGETEHDFAATMKLVAPPLHSLAGGGTGAGTRACEHCGRGHHRWRALRCSGPMCT